MLDTRLLRSSCKPLIGYSDITALLSLYLKHGLTAIHGPMVDRRLSKGPAAYDEDSFRRVVMTAEPAGDLRPDRSSRRCIRARATGVLVGGTLTQLMASMGTPWAFERAGGLRAVPRRHRRASVSHPSPADAGRAGGRVRERAGHRVRRVPRCDEPGGDPAIRDVLREFTADFRGPVLFNFPSGHTSGPTWTLPFGVKAEVTAGAAPVVRILEAAVQYVARIHLIGVAGTAMATLAALLKHRGHDVSGSDEHVYPPMSDFLAAERITVLEGYQAEHVQRPIDLVVVGNAISRGNAELEAVLDAGLRYASLPETIRDQWLWDAHSIVIAGTHGKTTTTSIAGWLLTAAGADPTVLIGGIARNFGADGASYRIGKGKAFVIEGDEYDSAYFDKTAKFLKYLPDIAVVNNIEFDHADIYADLDEVRLAFRRLVNLVPRSGLVLLGADSPDAAALAATARSRVQTFGLTRRRRVAGHRHARGGRHALPACRAADRTSASSRWRCWASTTCAMRSPRSPSAPIWVSTSRSCARGWRSSRA